MRAVANLSTMFQKFELLQRYEKASMLGFRCVEVSLPYSVPAEQLRAEAQRYDLQHILINAPPGQWSAGFRGTAALPEKQAEFEDGIEIAVKYANILSCKKIHVMAGISDVNDETRNTYVKNVRFAARRFAKEDITCLIEPINHISIPGYFLSSYDQALHVIKEVDERNLKIMFDVFHAQQICGRLSKTISSLAAHIGHVQVAQVPDRHEPDTDGEINFDYVFRTLQKYGDWDVGCEYTETAVSKDAVRWVQRFGLSF